MTSAHDIESNNPLELFDTYLQQAQQAEPNDANAAALATATSNGAPSVRMVLAKQVREHRFCFFTNAESRKGLELAENPRAALCFHWKSLRRQVRVEGTVSELAAQDADTYFQSRTRASKIGAAVSDQSRILDSREQLEERVRKFTEENPGEIPRPSYWRGYCLHPNRIEFWFNGPDRLHDRFLFTRDGDQWQRLRLYP
jgi:pyridoxamine 5'-phosphate oxidase